MSPTQAPSTASFLKCCGGMVSRFFERTRSASGSVMEIVERLIPAPCLTMSNLRETALSVLGLHFFINLRF